MLILFLLDCFELKNKYYLYFEFLGGMDKVYKIYIHKIIQMKQNEIDKLFNPPLEEFIKNFIEVIKKDKHCFFTIGLIAFITFIWFSIRILFVLEEETLFIGPWFTDDQQVLLWNFILCFGTYNICIAFIKSILILENK